MVAAIESIAPVRTGRELLGRGRWVTGVVCTAAVTGMVYALGRVGATGGELATPQGKGKEPSFTEAFLKLKDKAGRAANKVEETVNDVADAVDTERQNLHSQGANFNMGTALGNILDKADEKTNGWATGLVDGLAVRNGARFLSPPLPKKLAEGIIQGIGIKNAAKLVEKIEDARQYCEGRKTCTSIAKFLVQLKMCTAEKEIMERARCMGKAVKQLGGDSFAKKISAVLPVP